MPGECDPPCQAAPGEILIWLHDSSYEELDRQAILEGRLITGPASLDALNQQEGLWEIELITRSPDPPPWARRILALYFPEDADTERLLDVYSRNEHVSHVEPNAYYPMADGGEPAVVHPMSWGRIKGGRPRARASVGDIQRE